jgi:hypothetical protein
LERLGRPECGPDDSSILIQWIKDEGRREIRVIGRVGWFGSCGSAGFLLAAGVGLVAGQAQQQEQTAVIRQVDAAVMSRVNAIAGYTATEHYAVYRGSDETHPVAEMTVRTTYRRETGKSYQVLSQNGSALLRRLVLEPILEREHEINLPGNVEHAWINSANYEMTVKPGPQMLDGRPCWVLAINPKRKAPNLIAGAEWVDAEDGSIVRLEGVASKAPSVFAGETHVTRQYTIVDGFSMATHARAESQTLLYGKTVVAIDYGGYQIEKKAGL